MPDIPTPDEGRLVAPSRKAQTAKLRNGRSRGVIAVTTPYDTGFPRSDELQVFAYP
jgi:hypothetical protein